MINTTKVLIIGGGIAGVCCAQEIATILLARKQMQTCTRSLQLVEMQNQVHITMLSTEPVVRIPIRCIPLSTTLQQFDIESSDLQVPC